MIRINKDLVAYAGQLHRQESSSLLTIQEYQPGTNVIEQQKKVFAVYVIKSGVAKCYLTEDTGKDFVQEFFGEGELFGEIETFDHRVSLCSVQAISPFEVFKIAQNEFLRLLDEDRKFNRLIMEAMARKIRYKAERHAFHQSHRLEDNLLRLQEQLPGLTDVISKTDLANYLGITERSLNRTLSQLKASGELH